MSAGVVSPQPFVADLAVYDRRNRLALIAEARGMPIGQPDETVAHLAGLVGPVDYWLLADPACLRLYGRGEAAAGPLRELVVLDTRRTLTAYDPAVAVRPLSEFYLTALVDAWLGDLDLRWTSAEPPGTAELRGTGLLDRLRGAFTRREAIVDGDALR